MYKQLNQKMVWLSRKRVLLFVFFFSMALPSATIFFFLQKNDLAYLVLSVFVLTYSTIFFFLLTVIQRIKKISGELRVQKENYRVTLNSLGEGLITTNKTGQVVYMNPAAEQLTGWSWQDAKTRPLQEIYNVVNEETGMLLENIASRIIRQGKIIELENHTILKARDTGRFIISNTGAPLLDAQGNISGTVVVFNDITEKKKIEGQLKSSEQKYRSLIEQASDAILVYSFDGTIHEFNRSCYTMLGYSRDEYARLKLTDILVDEIIVNKNNYAAILAGETKTIYRHLVRKDGTLMEVEVTVKLLTDGKAIAFARDITERKKVEKALAESENYLRTIIEAEPECVKLLDINSLLEEINPAGLAMIEADNLQQVKGKSVLGIICEPYKKAFQRLNKDVFKGISGILQFEIIGLKGTHRWLETHAVPLKSADGKIISLLSVTREITERKNAETKTKAAIERYDILADATSDTIWDWDMVNSKMLYNDGITKMFGYNISEVEDVVDWWNEKLHPDDFQKVTESLNDIFEKRQQRFQMIYRFRCADGSYKNILDRAFVLLDENGRPARVIGAMQDITHEVQEEIRIAKAIIDAQEGERRFIGAELHDNINQILAGSLLFIGMVKSNQLDTEKAFEFLEAGKGYITDAINEIRKLSHELAPASFDDSCLKDIFDNLLVTLNLNNGYHIQFHFDELCNELNGEIQINLYRILQESTKNILKYSEATAIEITVTLSGNAVKMRVFDNGNGFNTKTIKKGIGLNNIKRRVESLSGKYLLNSAPEKGCEVIVEIPVTKGI